MNRYVVIDLETTGHSPENDDKIIELGLVVIENDQIVDSYATLINPKRSIPEFITHLTGITNDAVKDAPYFVEVAATITRYFENSYFIAHNVPFDLGFLNVELKQAGLSPLKNHVIDTVELSRILLPQAHSFKLNELANYLNLTHDEPHRALSDAYVTAQLFIHLKDKLFNLPYETIKQLSKLEHIFDSNLSNLLQNLLHKKAFEDSPKYMTTYNGIAVHKLEKNEKEEKQMTKSFSHFIDDIYLRENKLKKHVPTYEFREGQKQMSEHIYDAFQSENHTLIEAGTGTGKSLAYLLPAIYEATAKNERIIISTHTTNLQTQLLEESLKTLTESIDFSFQVALLKGKQHYISLERFIRSLEEEEHKYDLALTKAILLIWLTETTTGDVDEIRLPASGYKYFRSISAQADRNVYKTSLPSYLNYYLHAKENARNAHIIIVNHALLCTDIKNDYEILPTYEKAIIDEAHHLADVFSKTFGLHFSFLTIHHFLTHLNVITVKNKWIHYMLLKYEATTTINNHLTHWDSVMTDALLEIDDFFRYLYSFIKRVNQFNSSYNDVGRLQLHLDKKHMQTKEWSMVERFVERVNMYLEQLKEMLCRIEREVKLDSLDHDDLNAYIEQLNNFVHIFNDIFLKPNLEDNVIWFEIDRVSAENIVYIYTEQIKNATLLKDNFFEQKKSIVLTSATLTVRDSFSFIQNELGLTKETSVTHQLHSPFPFDEQVQLLIPNDFPHINEQMDEFIYATCEAIISLAEITQGRMLVLFTSYDMLRRTYYILKETLGTMQYTLIAQGISSGSRSRLKRSFQTYDNAILLGTSSFWEGIDIPGEDLLALMIVRLPFQPPNEPVYAAKAKALQLEKKNPFFELALPNAVIRFKQGFGRLIRSVNDRGVVFVCDSRIMTAKYGHFFKRSIPDVPTTYDSTKKLMKIVDDWI